MRQVYAYTRIYEFANSYLIVFWSTIVVTCMLRKRDIRKMHGCGFRCESNKLKIHRHIYVHNGFVDSSMFLGEK